eukprot:238543-Amorphochlora_amoeboformis.AAC.1
MPWGRGDNGQNSFRFASPKEAGLEVGLWLAVCKLVSLFISSHSRIIQHVDKYLHNPHHNGCIPLREIKARVRLSRL